MDGRTWLLRGSLWRYSGAFTHNVYWSIFAMALRGVTDMRPELRDGSVLFYIKRNLDCTNDKWWASRGVMRGELSCAGVWGAGGWRSWHGVVVTWLAIISWCDFLEAFSCCGEQHGPWRSLLTAAVLWNCKGERVIAKPEHTHTHRYFLI